MKFEYTTLETDSVEVTLQVYKLATLPVEVSFINAPRDFDPSVLVYSLSKKTLNVAGPESQIDRLSTLSVGTIDLSTFALDKVYEMPIELPSGIRLLDNHLQHHGQLRQLPSGDQDHEPARQLSCGSSTCPPPYHP